MRRLGLAHDGTAPHREMAAGPSVIDRKLSKRQHQCSGWEMLSILDSGNNWPCENNCRLGDKWTAR